MREAITREDAKTQEDENHNAKDLTAQGERLACRYLNWWASSHPASRLQAPHERAQASARHLPPGERQG